MDPFKRPITDTVATTTYQIVQLLIERGCQYSARNNQGFTASDYAYSSVVSLVTTVRRRRCLI